MLNYRERAVNWLKAREWGGVPWSELKIIMGTTWLRFKELRSSGWLVAWGLLFLLTHARWIISPHEKNPFLSFNNINSILAACLVAYLLLITRASVGNKTYRYVFCGQKTVVAGFWVAAVYVLSAIASLVTASTHGQYTLLMHLTSVLFLAPRGSIAWSIPMIICGYYLLDSPPSWKEYTATVCRAFLVFIKGWPLLLFVYFLAEGWGYLSKIMLALETGSSAFFVDSFCLVGSIVFWTLYVLFIAQWYISMRYREAL